MYTVITKGNEVHQYVSFDSVERSVEGPFLAIDSGNGSKVAFTATNPITWPDSATAGMQAIVDIKAGTLRFAYDGWPRAATEFVVSEYSESVVPFVSVEDSDPVNRPPHYTAGGIECIDAIKASMSTEAFLGFLKGNVQKYMWRYEKKVAPVEDLKKAQWYLSKLIEEQERSC